MSSQAVAAERFQSAAILRSDRATARMLRLWNQVPVADLDAGWAAVSASAVATVSAAVVQNAADANRMVARVARADGVAPGDQVVPWAFAGVDGSGRDVDGLLFGAVTTTKERIGRGVAPPNAFLAGAAYLAAMTKTAIADLARSSAATASTGRSYTRYIRMINPGACNRCAILAGSDRFSKPFQRHPACRCTSVPVVGDNWPDDLVSSPGEYFESLSEAEQDRIFTKSGAEAIRLGADPIQVVGARRGASGMSYSRSMPRRPGETWRMQKVPIGQRPDGSQIMGYTTVEGTSKRGAYGRIQRRLDETGFRSSSLSKYTRTTRSRLMPETILELTDDVDMKRVLLRDAGFLETPIRDRTSNTWIQERLRQQNADRLAADQFYRSLGIDLY